MKESKHNLADALFPAVRQQVLSFLFGQPDRQFYSNELIRLTESGRGAVQRELERLTDVGIVSVEKVGRQMMYQANPNSPLFLELRSIILKTVGLTDIFSQALLPVANDLQLAFVYGSIAKQEDTSSSDIDLFIVGELSLKKLSNIFSPIAKQLSREINPVVYSAEEFLKKLKSNDHFITSVLDSKRLWIIGDEDELRTMVKRKTVS